MALIKMEEEKNKEEMKDNEANVSEAASENDIIEDIDSE